MEKYISIVKSLIKIKNEEEWYEFKENWFEPYEIGAKEVAEYLGKSVNRVRKNICTGRWNHKDKYKAIVDEEGTEEMLIERYIDWQSRLADYHREYRKRRKEYDRITDCV